MNSANATMCIATQTLSQMQINIILTIPGALMHGISQGIIQGVSGGNAEQSFVTAAISSLAGSGFGMTNSLGSSPVGQSLFGGVVGGCVSKMQGGNFWEGAAIGLTVGLLNHAGKKLSDFLEARNLTKQFNKQLEKTREFFEKRGQYYDHKAKEIYEEWKYFPESYKTLMTTLTIDMYSEFVDLVKSGSPYDLKSNDNSQFSNKNLKNVDAYYSGQKFRVDDFGNFNFGVAAKAFGLSLNFSQLGAGLYQIYSGTSSWKFIKTYFDDPRDYSMIQRGYKHF